MIYCTIFSSPDSPEAEDEKKHVDGEKKYEESQKQDLQCRSCFKIFVYLKNFQGGVFFLVAAIFGKHSLGKQKKMNMQCIFSYFMCFSSQK